MRNKILGGCLFLYLVLLAASWWARQDITVGKGPEEAVLVEVPEWQWDERTGRQIQLAYRDTGEADLPPVVLLHGSPVASVSLTPLMKAMEGQARLIVPDLPGFGGSTLRIEDYSTRAHGHSVIDLLDHLEIREVHLVGYSMGGGVGLEIANLRPEAVRSLVLVSSIGVQELEWLGDYTLNHAVHGLQLATLALLQAGTPHFGALDYFPLNREYARNFYDSDQRPFRGYLLELDAPAQIIHGVGDGLVPLAAATEHHRLLPQSELVVLDPGDHITVIREPERVAGPLMDFVNRVEQGEAVTRETADPDRRSVAAEPFEAHRPESQGGTFLIVMMVLLGLATFVTEDLTCIGAGLLVARGGMEFWWATLACLLGIFVGDMLVYLAGRWFGRPALSRAPLKWCIKAEQVERGEGFFKRQGPALVFATRFVPGTRLPTYFASGMFRAPFWKFVGWFLLAAAVWTPCLVGLAVVIGGPFLKWFESFSDHALLGLAVVVLVLLAIVKLGVPLLSHRGRRLLLSSWRRKVRWEFWPMAVFYPPVIVYLIWLALRHRSLTVFSAANPSIPHGGLVMESKSEILAGLGERPEVATWRLLPLDEPEAMWQALLQFMEEHRLTFPVVLKPDIGERGAGVRVVRSEAMAKDYFASAEEPIIAQRYVGGREFGVFYYRHPDKDQGQLFSITDKRLIRVEGDGERRLGELILDDDRAVCMAPFFLQRWADRIEEVPASGETFALTEVGTHCRGALFLDGNEHRSEALRRVIDEVSRGYDGFYFGRYDLRVPDEEALEQGRDLQILELNGVTSESTDIYDPKNGLFHAYRTLFAQWRIAFAIGEANAKRGAKVSSPKELWRVWRQSKRR